MKLRSILLPILLLISGAMYAQKASRIISIPPVTYNVALMDTSITIKLNISFVYNSDSARLLIKDDTVALKPVYEPFSPDKFRSVFDNYIVTVKNIEKPIANQSLLVLYNTMIDTIYGSDKAPLAGTIYFNQYVMALTNTYIIDTIRTHLRDSLQSLIVPKKIKMEAALATYESYRDSLFNKYTFTNKYDQVLKPAQLNDEAAFKGLKIEAKKATTEQTEKADMTGWFKREFGERLKKAITTKTPGQYVYTETLKKLAASSNITIAGVAIDITDPANYPVSPVSMANWTATPKIDKAGILKAINDVIDFKENRFFEEKLMGKYTVQVNGVAITTPAAFKALSADDSYMLTITDLPAAAAASRQSFRDSIRDEARELFKNYNTALQRTKNNVSLKFEGTAFNFSNSTDLNRLNGRYKETGRWSVDTVLPAGQNYTAAVKAILTPLISALPKKPDGLTVNPPTADQNNIEQFLIAYSNSHTAKLNGFAADIKQITASTDLTYITIDTILPTVKPDTTYKTTLPANLKELLKAYNDLKADYAKINEDFKKNGLCKVKHVEVQFERGFIERVEIVVEVNGVDKTFENIFPIGFSSPYNYRQLTNMVLWVRESENKSPTALHIYLADVIQLYDNALDNFTRDYSPADTTIKGDPANMMQANLHKEEFLNLFEVKAFTDLAGIGNSRPNGLVQLQIERRINLLTVRHQLSRQDYGFLNYIQLQINASKLENKQRRLILSNQRIVNAGQLVSPSYATNLDYRMYENFSIAVQPSVFLFDFPDAKITFHTDLGFRYGYTPVTDSVLVLDSTGTGIQPPLLTTNLDAHTFAVYPKLWLEFFSERRFGFTMGYQFNTTWLFSNNQFKQVVSYSNKAADIQTNAIEPAARFSHVIELTGRVEPNKKDRNGTIFLAARFFMQHHDVNTFFPQIQIGYSYNLLFKK